MQQWAIANRFACAFNVGHSSLVACRTVHVLLLMIQKSSFGRHSSFCTSSSTGNRTSSAGREGSCSCLTTFFVFFGCCFVRPPPLRFFGMVDCCVIVCRDTTWPSKYCCVKRLTLVFLVTRKQCALFSKQSVLVVVDIYKINVILLIESYLMVRQKELGKIVPRSK